MVIVLPVTIKRTCPSPFLRTTDYRYIIRLISDVMRGHDTVAEVGAIRVLVVAASTPSARTVESLFLAPTSLAEIRMSTCPIFGRTNLLHAQIHHVNIALPGVIVFLREFLAHNILISRYCGID